MIKRIMIARFLVISITSMLFATRAGAQENLPIDSIIQKYTQALGGRENWQRVQGVKLTGILTTRGMDYPMTILHVRPNLCRFEFINDGKKQITAFDGQAAWEAAEQQNFEKKTIRDARTKNFIEMFAVSVDALVDYKTKGYQIKLLSQEKVDSDMAYKLEVAFASDRTEHWFINTKSFLPGKRTAVFTHREEQAEQRIYYFDYQPVEGCMIPRHLERTVLHYVWGYEIAEVEINPATLKADFELNTR